MTNGEQLYNEWDKNDPFVFLPLNPVFTNIIPKVGEYCTSILQQYPENSELLDLYIGVYVFLQYCYERYDSAVTNFDEGTRNKPFFIRFK